MYLVLQSVLVTWCTVENAVSLHDETHCNRVTMFDEGEVPSCDSSVQKVCKKCHLMQPLLKAHDAFKHHKAHYTTINSGHTAKC